MPFRLAGEEEELPTVRVSIAPREGKLPSIKTRAAPAGPGAAAGRSGSSPSAASSPRFVVRGGALSPPVAQGVSRTRLSFMLADGGGGGGGLLPAARASASPAPGSACTSPTHFRLAPQGSGSWAFACGSRASTPGGSQPGSPGAGAPAGAQHLLALSALSEGAQLPPLAADAAGCVLARPGAPAGAAAAAAAAGAADSGAVDARAALRAVAQRIAVPEDAEPPRRLLSHAWGILLDLDADAPAAGPGDGLARERSNRREVAQACLELHERLRPADAARLQQLATAWLGAAHYLLWAPERADDGDCAPEPRPARLGEQHAALSLLLALKGSCPPPPAALAALPPLGSGALAGVAAAAQAALQRQAEAAAAASWLSPAAAGLELMLVGLPLDAAAGAAREPGAGEGGQGGDRGHDCDRAAPSLAEGLAAKMALAARPPDAQRHLGAALGKAGGGAGNASDVRAGARDQGPPGAASSRAAAAAAAAVAAAGDVRPRMLELMLAAGEPPQPGEPLALPGRGADGPGEPARALRLASGGAGAGGAPAPATSAPGAGASPAAARAEREERLVALACLASQGVWTAVAELWELAAGGAPARGPAGVARPAAARHLITRVLRLAELRLRLQAFVQHFSASAAAAASAAGRWAGAAGEEAGDGAPVLQAYLAAVREVLRMHDAAIQVLQQRAAQRRRGRPRGASAAAPGGTLLALVVQLRAVDAQLQQLARCCWCGVAACDDGEPSPGDGCATSTERALGAHARAAGGGGGGGGGAFAAGARARALPWPGAAAAWAERWGWEPSRWQEEQGFLQGRELLEGLYDELLHAGPQTAPLLRHLFAAAMQPLLQRVRDWGFRPDLRAAEAAAGAAQVLAMAASPGAGAVEGAAAARATWASSGGGAPAAGAAGGSGPASGAADRAAQAAASQLLLTAWAAAKPRAPACPRFLAGAQQALVVAGLQLQLLQLLGGPAAELAERLGWLAELEQQELREVLCRPPSGPGAPAAPAGGGGTAASGWSSLALLLGGRGAAAAGGAEREGAGGAAFFPLSLSMQQLEHAAAVVSDYEAARELELVRVTGGLAAARAAGAAAEELWAADRQRDKAAAEARRAALQRAADERKRARQRELLLQQQEEMAAAAARHTKARQDELALDRALLAQNAAAAHRVAHEALAAEVARAQRAGVDVPPALQARLAGSAAAAARTATAARPAPAGSGPAAPASAGGPGTASELPSAEAEQLHEPPPAGAPPGPQAAPGSPLGGAAEQPEQLTEEECEPGQPERPEPLAQPELQGAAAQPHKRATWGPAVDPSPAAGAPSGAAGALAVVGAAAAEAAPLPAAGRPSNSRPKQRPGTAAALPSPRGSGGGWSGGAYSARASDEGFWGSGGGSAAGSLGGAAGRQLQQQPAARLSKWGPPVLPGQAAGLPSAAQRARSCPGLPPGAAWQQRLPQTLLLAQAAPDSAAPLITTLEVLLVRPLLAQHRLTTLACWQLLLQDRGLLRQLGALQRLFFQQQGDWCDLLLEGLEAQLVAAPRRGGHARGGGAPLGDGGGGLSPTAAQLLLEAAVQQSCLAAAPEAERMSLQVDAGRRLPGWGSAGDGAGATDALRLSYEVTWPLSLLVGSDQVQRYADAFSVLLRLRRLQQQLSAQWAAVNGRPGGGGGRAEGGGAGAPAGLERLQALRRWHALALHCAGSVLGCMLGELSGKLWIEFEAAVSSAPVSLPSILAEHDRLLSAAAAVCLLPPADVRPGGGGAPRRRGGTGGGGRRQPALEVVGEDDEPGAHGLPGGSVADTVRQLAGAAWRLQQAVAAVLAGGGEAAARPVRGAGGGSRFVEGASSCSVAERLAADGGGCWSGLEGAGLQLESLLRALRRQLAAARASGTEQSLAGLAARLGVQGEPGAP
ncbi:hypothetical protein HT031_005889 [Scenedesmus sp. PABB004]|nr:hypothetical protein HT031_005889 [Scenedesmus sp. PABB004]